MNIGQSIKSMRLKYLPRFTQIDFAERIGITQAYLSQIENGKKQPSTEVLQKIADFFEVPLPILFWFGVEERDIKPNKVEHFRFLKPMIDKMIKSIF